ncbi:MAG: aminotransferase class I/II-fold pyridoxal phosphate-dependent enzyme [Myxococcales bacterium]|nr:aminotransferase class I/II-fold pyridoxal phosphate-dependent enzyme [Myxococcales bacterium]
MSDEQYRKIPYATEAIHASIDRGNRYRSLTPPIVQSATFLFDDTAELFALKTGQLERPEYGRYGNPTVSALARQLCALEGPGADDALLFSCGMAAITTTLLALLSAGDHLVYTQQSYRRTLQFCEEILPRFGVQCSEVPAVDASRIIEAIRPGTRVVLLEMPTNPYLYLCDVARVVEAARAVDAQVIIDATFATPYNLRPLELGVDLVIHSATKYLGGHNDVLAGAVIGAWHLVLPIRQLQGITGAILSPASAYLISRGLKTFPLRMQRHNENALRVSRFLESHPKVVRVYYPGLESHPDHELARRLLRGSGGVVSFEVAGDFAAAGRFIDKVRLPLVAPSFGGTESLIEQPALMSYFDSGERARFGISDNLIRMSVGLEDADDIIADLRQALDSYS